MKNRKLYVIIVFLVIFIGVSFTWLIVNWDKLTQSPVVYVNPNLDPDAQELTGEVPKDDRAKLNDNSISIPGYKSITLKADQQDQKVLFMNPPENKCYFTVSLWVDGVGIIYKSKMFAPDKEIAKISISPILKAGTYKAKVIYECFNMQNLLALNNAEVVVELIVK